MESSVCGTATNIELTSHTARKKGTHDYEKYVGVDPTIFISNYSGDHHCNHALQLATSPSPQPNRYMTIVLGMCFHYLYYTRVTRAQAHWLQKHMRT